MANQKQKLVGLYLRYRTPEGKQSPCGPVLFDAKNRLRPGWCLVIDVEERHPDCTYHLRYKRDGVWKGEAVGDDPNTGTSPPYGWKRTLFRQNMIPNTMRAISTTSQVAFAESSICDRITFA